jgi:hypothetical protein
MLWAIAAFAFLAWLFPMPEVRADLAIAPWIIPLVISLGSAYFSNKNKDKGGTQVPPGPFADWLQTGMLPGGGGGGGGPVTTTRDETQRRNLLTMPVISDEYQPLNALLNNLFQQRLRFPGGIPPQYEAQGIQRTNQTFAPLSQALENKLYASGAMGGPAAGVPLATMEGLRGQALADFRNSLPALARQWQNEDASFAGQLIAQLGRGQRETGTVRTTGTSTSTGGGGGGGGRFDPQGPLAWLQMQQQDQNQPGFWDRMLPMLGMMIGAGLFGGKPSTGKA